MNKHLVIKSLRTIWRNRRAYLSGIFVLAIGLSVFIGMLSTMMLFNKTVESYFKQTHLADVFAEVVSIPKDAVNNLVKIDGIAQSQGVLEHSVSGRVQGFDDVVSVRLIGTDERNERRINTYEYTGEPIGTNNDIWLGKTFYDTHNLSIGDTISLLIDGQYVLFNICGTVASPEYMVAGLEGGAIVDVSMATIGFVHESIVESSAGMSGMVNNISITLDTSYTFNNVQPFLEEALEKYGLIRLISRDNHQSFSVVVSELDAILTIVIIIPPLFLGIACAILYVMLNRSIEMERTEIGTLKALGFSNRFILNGYLLQGAVVAFVGFVLAQALGRIIGSTYYNLIMGYYAIEPKPFALEMQMNLFGLLIALSVSLFTIMIGTKAALKIQPAEAMRAASPISTGSKIQLDNLFIRLFFDTGGKYAIRSILRNRKRIVTTILSVGTAFALVNILFTLHQNIITLNDSRYTQTEVSDVTVILSDFKSADVILRDIERINGVVEAEAVLSVPVVIDHNGNTRSLVIYGLDKNASLLNIFDIKGNRYRPTIGGLILHRFYAEDLGIAEGEKVALQNTNFYKDAVVEVSLIIEERFGMGAYMEIGELSKLFGSETVSNMLLIDIEEEFFPMVREKILAAGNVDAFNDNLQGLAYNREMAQSTIVILNIMTFISVVICFAVVYNTAMISLGEKQREYATLRLLGFQVSDVSAINNFEYALILFAGSIIGTVISYYATPPISASFNYELAIANTDITLLSTLLAFVCCSLAVMVSCTLIKKHIKKFMLADVLKERE